MGMGHSMGYWYYYFRHTNWSQIFRDLGSLKVMVSIRSPCTYSIWKIEVFQLIKTARKQVWKFWSYVSNSRLEPICVTNELFWWSPCSVRTVLFPLCMLGYYSWGYEGYAMVWVIFFGHLFKGDGSAKQRKVKLCTENVRRIRTKVSTSCHFTKY